MFSKILKTIIPSEQHKSEFEMLLKKAQTMPRFVPTTISFEQYKLHIPDLISVVYQLEEFMISKKFEFNTVNDDVPVIYDCGANVGVASIFFSKRFPNAVIKAFEPDPKIIPYLKENLFVNGIENVRVFEEAVWVDNNGLEFGSEGADGGSIYFPSNKIRVNTVRLKDKLSEDGNISFLKLDIEGAEESVLKDCENELHKVKYLFVEYHSWKERKQKLSELLSVLENNNFRYNIESLPNKGNYYSGNNCDNRNMDLQLNIYAVNKSI